MVMVTQGVTFSILASPHVGDFAVDPATNGVPFSTWFTLDACSGWYEQSYNRAILIFFPILSRARLCVEVDVI